MQAIPNRSEPSRRHYQRPPLEEAVFELFLHAEDARPLPGEGLRAFWGQLAAFSTGEENLVDQSVVVQVGPGAVISHAVGGGATRVRRWTADRTRAVQITPRMCTLNVRQPYGHFEDHLPALQSVLDAFLATTSAQRTEWVGQRYINFIELPITDADPARFFAIYPGLPASLAGLHRPVAVQVQTEDTADSATMVNLALLELRASTVRYVLDVYARSSAAVPVTSSAIIDWHRSAHDAVVRAFELSITDELRAVLGETQWPH